MARLGLLNFDRGEAFPADALVQFTTRPMVGQIEQALLAVGSETGV